MFILICTGTNNFKSPYIQVDTYGLNVETLFCIKQLDTVDLHHIFQLL